VDEEIRKSPSDPDQATDLEGGGQSRGRPADGVLDSSEGSSTFGSSPGMNHWPESVISRPGLEERGNVSFPAI